MMLSLQIAFGIVIAYVVIRFWSEIVASGVALVAALLALACVVGGCYFVYHRITGYRFDAENLTLYVFFFGYSLVGFGAGCLIVKKLETWGKWKWINDSSKKDTATFCVAILVFIFLSIVTALVADSIH